MSYISLLILAIALSVDASIVAFSYGIKYNSQRIKNSMLISSFTGIFQGLMPVGGYCFTELVRTFIEPYSNVIVFLIFTYLGIKFITEAILPKRKKDLCIDLKCLILIGIATSIDAFSAGITLSLYNVSIIKSALLIALITFINANIGFYTGCKLKHLKTQNIEITAGIILIFLGIKSLLT